jgi:hypothetical protein
MRLVAPRLAVALLAALSVLAAIGSFLFIQHRFISHQASSPSAGSAPGGRRCLAVSHACGYPDATNSGVPSGMTLKTVPGQVSSGPGWAYSAASQEVDVTGNGAVLTGLNIPYNLNIKASNVTVNDSKIVTSGSFGVDMRHTAGVTIENSTISGANATSGRVNYAVTDIYGDSTGTVVKNDDISAFRTAVQLDAGTVTGNYIHDPGYITGDHTNGVFANGGASQLTITDNTILNSRNQTDAINLDTEQGTGPVSNKTIENNLLAGGGYCIYGGNVYGHTTSNILIENNRFGQTYYPKGGLYGPVAYYSTTQPGNVWSGNTWTSSGKLLPASMAGGW